MSKDFQLSQEFVTRAANTGADEPPVIGCGGAQQVWIDAYVGRMIERGVHPDDALACCMAGRDDHDYDEDPRDMADDEMSYWDDDGDGPPQEPKP